MNKVIRFILYLLIALPLISVAKDWKELKNLKAYVKASNITEGRKLLTKCLADTSLSREPELYSLAVALEAKANDTENTKLYLGQSYDTAAFFSSVSNIVEYSVKLDSIMQVTDSKKADKELKKNRQSSRPYYLNLFSGGAYFIKAKNWKEADRALSLYIDLAHSERFSMTDEQAAVKIPRAAFMSMRACYESQRYADVFKYIDLAEDDSVNMDYTLQCEALSYEQLRDTANYVRTLYRGLAELNESSFFFSRLTDYLNAKHQYETACQLNDSLLEIRPSDTLYLYALTVVLYNLASYDRCIDNTKRLLELQPDNIEANYYMGLCLYNKGLAYERTLSPNPTSKEYKTQRDQLNEMYRQAMPYLEKVREAYPNDKTRWHAPLYKIYFNLNMSDKLSALESK